MKNFEKYERSYFMPPEISYDWVKKDYIDKAPIWCSVDLRDCLLYTSYRAHVRFIELMPAQNREEKCNLERETKLLLECVYGPLHLCRCV